MHGYVSKNKDLIWEKVMAAKNVPWKKEYRLVGIPSTFAPYTDKPVYDILAENARKYRKNGLVQLSYKMTYPELKDKVDRLATAFFNMGLKKGDRVATILPTSIQFILADYAISRAGLVHIPCSSLEPADTLEHKLKEGTPRAIIAMAGHVDVISILTKRIDIDFIILTKLDDYGTTLADLQEYEETYKFANVRFTTWMTELIKKNSPEPPEVEYDVVNDVETLLFTGGTTGVPKGCMLTHRNIFANSVQNLHALGQIGLVARGGISVLLSLPFFHSYGHVIMHAMMLYGFNLLLVPEPRDTKGMADMIKEHFPVLQIGVPVQFMNLAREELKGYAMLGISGSAPLAEGTQKEFEEKTGGGIMEGYGLSEMSPVSHLNTSILTRIIGGRTPLMIVCNFLRIPGVGPVINTFIRLMGTRLFGKMFTKILGLQFRLTANSGKKGKKTKEKRGTIGVPFPDTEVKIIDVDTQRELSWEEMLTGKTGEMLLRGPQRMLGYWPDAGSGIDEDGYIHTSDVVRIDERGYFYIVDRTKDMIIVSGYKVYSREVDDILNSHTYVEMAATIGIPDPDREGSERVAVYIQPREEFRAVITEAEVMEFLKSKIAKYALPKYLKIVDELPLTEVQKINKKLLRQWAVDDFLGKINVN
jgi:acyl-CoA synthetase (AMP-forming)/AMP-acid ligase II